MLSSWILKSTADYQLMSGYSHKNQDVVFVVSLTEVEKRLWKSHRCNTWFCLCLFTRHQWEKNPGWGSRAVPTLQENYWIFDAFRCQVWAVTVLFVQPDLCWYQSEHDLSDCKEWPCVLYKLAPRKVKTQHCGRVCSLIIFLYIQVLNPPEGNSV